MKKYLVFDFDGTVINTNDVIIASWQATWEKFLGYRESAEIIKSTFGETLKFTAEQRFPAIPTEDVINYYRDYQLAHCDELVYIFDGMEDILRDLKSRGYKMAIATSRTREGTLKYLNQFGITDCFDAIVSMDDVSNHKPAPDTCLVALEKLGGTPEEALMFGDTRFDICCAINAGVDSVLVGWGEVTTADQLGEIGYQPTYVAETIKDLYGIFEIA